jgi:hypothetical protein
MSREGERMKFALVTIVTANHEEKYVFRSGRAPARVGEALSPAGAPTTAYQDAVVSRPRP